MRLLLLDTLSECDSAVGELRLNLCRTALSDYNIVQHASKSLTMLANRSRLMFLLVDITYPKNRRVKRVLPPR